MNLTFTSFKCEAKSAATSKFSRCIFSEGRVEQGVQKGDASRGLIEQRQEWGLRRFDWELRFLLSRPKKFPTSIEKTTFTLKISYSFFRLCDSIRCLADFNSIRCLDIS